MAHKTKPMICKVGGEYQVYQIVFEVDTITKDSYSAVVRQILTDLVLKHPPTDAEVQQVILQTRWHEDNRPNTWCCQTCENYSFKWDWGPGRITCPLCGARTKTRLNGGVPDEVPVDSDHELGYY